MLSVQTEPRTWGKWSLHFRGTAIYTSWFCLCLAFLNVSNLRILFFLENTRWVTTPGVFLHCKVTSQTRGGVSGPAGQGRTLEHPLAASRAGGPMSQLSTHRGCAVVRCLKSMRTHQLCVHVWSQVVKDWNFIPAKLGLKLNHDVSDCYILKVWMFLYDDRNEYYWYTKLGFWQQLSELAVEALYMLSF